MNTFLLMAGVQFLSYLNLTINFRAIAAGNTLASMLTDAVASAVSYFIIRKVSKTEDGWALVGMIVGGSLASALGIFLTKGWV